MADVDPERADAEPAAQPGRAGSRYSARRDAIIAAAAEVINDRGVKAMTLSEVAGRVGLIKNSITYYFKRREDLAVACFLNGIERLEALVRTALKQETAQGRLKSFLELYFEMHRRVQTKAEPAFPVFSDIRALSEENLQTVWGRYEKFFARALRIFDAPGCPPLSHEAAVTRTHIMLEVLYWSVAWLPFTELSDLPRIVARIVDLLTNGMHAPGGVWTPTPLAAPTPRGPLSAKESMLRAATKLINERGYRGVSVDEISAEVNLTKGAVYHHHDAKSDLVIACFERSFDIMRSYQTQGMKLEQSSWAKLCATAQGIALFQTSKHGPLIRTSALITVPLEVRLAIVERANAVGQRFAAVVADGMADGSIRAVDPLIAAQVVAPAMNAAAEFGFWTPNADREAAGDLYARPTLMGLFCDDPQR